MGFEGARLLLWAAQGVQILTLFNARKVPLLALMGTRRSSSCVNLLAVSSLEQYVQERRGDQ